VEDAVEAFNNAWLLPPQQGEVFETAKACLRRLQGRVRDNLTGLAKARFESQLVKTNNALLQFVG
jgi:hypothetical protein